MKHLAAYGLGFLFIGVATFLLIENAKTLGAAHVLLGAIIGCYVLGAVLIAPAQMNQARAQLAAWWQTYKGTLPPPPSGGMGVVG